MKLQYDLIAHDPKSIKTLAGVYFLLDENKEVLYIGSSKNVYSRIIEHRKTKDFSFFSVIPIDPRQFPIKDIEADLIAEYLPPLNKTISKSNRFVQATTINDNEHKYYKNIFELNGTKYIDLFSRVMAHTYIINHYKESDNENN